MTKPKDVTKQGRSDELRRIAEARLEARSRASPDHSGPQDLQRLLHELQVHQIELEMQNNELYQSRGEVETALTNYTELYDFAPVGYLTLTPDGLIAKINLTGATLLGVARQNLMQKKFTSFVIPAEMSRWSEHLLRMERNEEASSVEFALQRSDGTSFYAQLDCSPTSISIDTALDLSPQNVPQEVRFTLTDISARRQAEAERERLNRIVQDKNAELEIAKFVAEKANLAKSDFLSNMSHELRTPLSAILGFAQLMEIGSPAPTPSQQRSIEQILKAGWYLLELINEILDLAVIESGKLILSLEPVALAEVLCECQVMIEPLAEKYGIGVTFPPTECGFLVNADRTRVKQVVINLLSNAIKYNTEGGSVHVACALNTPDSLRISISDTGTGLTPEQLAQLFQPFNRLGQTTSVVEGTGIGLMVSKRLVELMGGTIGVASTVGKGSVFWIELNLASPLPASAARSNAQNLAQLPAEAEDSTPLRTLLYVEDNPANLMLVEDIVARRSDIRLLTAKDAKSGVELARTWLPEVILMDINLPGVSGIDALKMLAQDPLTAHIPVIAISANAIPQDIHKGLEAGFFRYLTKPIKINEFMYSLDVALKFAQTATAKGGVA
jgi:PAS domain S-box-containing protein